MTELPPVVQPDVWYSYGPSAEFPELGSTPPGGIGPMAGPAYDFERKYVSGSKAIGWPQYFDGVPLFYEWTRDYIKEFRLTDAGEVGEINQVLPTLASPTLDNGMDLEFGPQGALYTLEYGDGFFSENPDAQLARIDYIGPGGNHAPQVQVSADPTRGEAPLTVEFSSAGTTDPDGDRLRYRWDLDADGKADSRSPNPTFTYREDGVYLATLNVTDEHGRSAAQYVEILVGNQPPESSSSSPRPATEPFAFGDAVDYEVSVTDEADDRLQPGAGALHRRPRHPRPSAVDDRRLHRHDPDHADRGPRPGRYHRGVRGGVHGSGRPRAAARRSRSSRAEAELCGRRAGGAERPARPAPAS